jgi:hypothetical protein
MTVRRADIFTLIAAGLFASSCAVLLAGCGKSHVRSGTSSPDFDRAALRSGLVIEVDTTVALNGFHRSFADAYGSGRAFASGIARRVADSLNGGTPRIPARLATDTGAIPGTPYRLRLRNFAVDATARELPTMILPTYGANTKAPAGGGTSKGCAISLDVEILEGDATRLSFSVTGTADVPLFAYKTALREAAYAAARRTAWHLRGE